MPADLHAFEFFAAGRVLQRENPGYSRIGYSAVPAQDPIRFAQSPALDFAPAMLEALQQRGGSKVPVLYCRHFGLFGPNGPLPLCLTDYARLRILHHGDPTFAAFCNVFHHRMSCFFFRAWADAQKTVDLDRPAEAVWPKFVGSLVGIGLESLEQGDSLPDNAKIYYAGRLVQQNRNAEGLQAILQDFFGVLVAVQTFMGRWINLPPESICRFAGDCDARQLGATLIVGAKIWNCQMSFRLRMGPMTLGAFERLLPTGASFKRLRDWVRLYTSDEFTWDVQFVLARQEVPVIQLGRYGQLGWTTWLKTQPFAADADNLVLQASDAG